MPDQASAVRLLIDWMESRLQRGGLAAVGHRIVHGGPKYWLPQRITPEMMENLCQPPSSDLPQQPLSFPYEFPKPGRYRIWVQIKAGGKVHTGVFDAEVLAGK